jgi:parvulin-like peptidyl-prolyl isomerase
MSKSGAGCVMRHAVIGLVLLMSVLRIISKKDMPTIVKPLIISAVAGLLLLSAGLSLSQSESTIQKAPLKANTAPPNRSANPQSKPEEDEKIPPAAPGAIFPAIIARVNGEAILGRDLELLVRQELSSIGNPEWKNLRGEYRSQLALEKITSLINSKLLYQKATASGIKAADAEVQSEFQKIAKQYKSDVEMNADLASQNMDRATLKKSLYETMTASKYLEETINKKIVVAPEEPAKYYSSHPEEFRHPDMVRTSHILIQAAGNTAEQDSMAKERAEALLARIQKGEDFAKLAKEYSMDSSASKGGDIGYVSKEELFPEYSDAAFSLPVGGVTLIKSQYGYHIIKVIDKKKEGVSTLEDVKPQLKEFLRIQKYQEELNKLVNQLREKANIEILISAGELLNP